jgi:hypothetical protein
MFDVVSIFAIANLVKMNLMHYFFFN